MSNVMTVKDLCLWYGSAQALKDINIEIEERSITALIGPSGCGKSTFLKSLNRTPRRECSTISSSFALFFMPCVLGP